MDKNIAYTLVSLAEPEVSGTSLIIFPLCIANMCSFCSIPVAWSVLHHDVRSGLGALRFPAMPQSSYKCFGRGICTRGDNANVQHMDDKSICYLDVKKTTAKRTKRRLFFPCSFQSSDSFVFAKSN